MQRQTTNNCVGSLVGTPPTLDSNTVQRIFQTIEQLNQMSLGILQKEVGIADFFLGSRPSEVEKESSYPCGSGILSQIEAELQKLIVTINKIDNEQSRYAVLIK